MHFVLVCVFATTLDATSMAKKRNTPFQIQLAVELSLRICESSAGTIPVVVTAVCRSCEVFEKE